jgi:hypothetical protein
MTEPSIEQLQAEARGANQQGVRLDGGGDDRPPVYQTDDGTWVYRASAVGKLCERALWLARTGVPHSPPPANLQTAFVQSANGESVAIAMAEDRYYMQVEGRQDTIQIEVAPGVEIRGSIDGYTKADETWLPGLVEVKCIRSEDWSKRGRGVDLYPGWREQVNLYMKGLGYKFGVLVMGRKDTEGVVDDIAYTNYEYDPRIYARIKNKVLAVEKAVAEGVSLGCDDEKWGCPYWQFHEGTQTDVEEIHDQQADTISNQIMRAQATKKETERKIADLKAQLEKWRTDHNVGPTIVVVGKTGKYKVTQVTPSRKVWDDDKLAVDGIDLDAYRTVQQGTPYLLVQPEED